MKTLGYRPCERGATSRRDKARGLPVCSRSARAGSWQSETRGAPWPPARSHRCPSRSAWCRSRSSCTRPPRARPRALQHARTRTARALKQQYVSEKDQQVVERAEMVKGYEFEKDRFVHLPARGAEGAAGEPEPHDRHRRVHPREGGRSDLLRQGLLPRARQARRQALQPADRGDARERPLRARQVGVEGQAVRRAGAAGRRRPRAAAAALRRRSALDEGARHREGHGLARPSSSWRCS